MINIFDTRIMVAAVELIPEPKTFVKSMLFPEVIRSEAEFIDFDVKKYGRAVAPFFSEKKGTSTVERPGFDFKSFTPPSVGQHTVTTAADVIKRGFGSNLYSSESLAARAGKIMRSDFIMMDNMITRREEWMCARLINDGVIYMLGDGVDQKLDLTEKWNYLDISKTAKSWDKADAFNPTEDLDDWTTMFMKQASGLRADIAILGSTAAKLFKRSTAWLNEQKFIRTTFGDWTPKYLGKGVKYIGSYMGLELYEYLEWFVDDLDANKEKPMIDHNKVILGSTEGMGQFGYGAVYTGMLNASGLPLSRYPRMWETPNPIATYLELKSRPIPIPKNLDAFLTITVCPVSVTADKLDGIIRAQKNASSAVKEAT